MKGIYLADALLDWSARAEIDGKWVLARPIGYFGLHRFRMAWMVFTGRADVLTWYGQEGR